MLLISYCIVDISEVDPRMRATKAMCMGGDDVVGTCLEIEPFH